MREENKEKGKLGNLSLVKSEKKKKGRYGKANFIIGYRENSSSKKIIAFGSTRTS